MSNNLGVFILGALIPVILYTVYMMWKGEWRKARPLPFTPSPSAGPAPAAPEPTQENVKAATRQTTLDTLRALGCQPTEEEDGGLLTQYQGEWFSLRFNDSMWVYVIDHQWAEFDPVKNDLDKVYAAVNQTNVYSMATLVTHENDNGFIGLTSIRLILMAPELTDKSAYLSSCLGNFFTAKQLFARAYRDDAPHEEA